MAFDTTPILLKKKIKSGEIFEFEDCIPLRDGLHGHLSIQGLVEGGDIDVLLQYANCIELGWTDFTTVSYEDGVMKQETIDRLYPCRYLKYSFTNNNANDVTVSLVPCYI
jgi:hypothetical protein